LLLDESRILGTLFKLCNYVALKWSGNIPIQYFERLMREDVKLERGHRVIIKMSNTTLAVINKFKLHEQAFAYITNLAQQK
jgi:hypothetical protein